MSRVSKVILAHFPHDRLKAIYPRHRTEIQAAGLGARGVIFRKTLGEIKKAGYLLTMGEFNPGVYGVAAPILTDQKTALGSVGVAWDENARRDVDVEQAVLAVKQAAATISERLMEKQRRFMSPKVRDGQRPAQRHAVTRNTGPACRSPWHGLVSGPEGEPGRRLR